MEKTLSLSEAKAKLNSLVDEVVAKDHEFVLTKNGKPVAVLMSADHYEGWKETKEIQSDPKLMKAIKKGIDNLKKGKKRHTFEEVFGEPL